MTLKAVWHDKGREPQGKANPEFPEGIDLDLSKGAKPTCSTALTYPAPRCGHFFVVCQDCELTTIVSTAGRADDPRSVKMACNVRRLRELEEH